MLEFSIIIPCYNCSGFVVNTLDSIKSQSCKKYEIVITDDGSSDNSYDIIENYIKENPQMKIILNRQQNKGIGSARNASIRLSSGNILAFMDDDDIWYPKKLEHMALYYNAHPETDVLSHNVYKRYPNGRKKILPTSNPGDYPFSSLLLKGNTLAVSATSVRREAFERAGYFADSLKGAEDYEMWLRLAQAGCRFGYVDEYLGELARRPDSYSLARISTHLEGVMDVIDKYAGIMLESNKEKSKRIKKAIASRKAGETASSTIKLLRNRDYAAAFRHLKQILQLLFTFHQIY